MKRFNFTRAKRLRRRRSGASTCSTTRSSWAGTCPTFRTFQTNAVSRNFLIPGNVSFGNYQGYFPSNSRQLQLVAHFVF